MQEGSQIWKNVREDTWLQWRRIYREKFKKEWDNTQFTVLASISLLNKKNMQSKMISMGFGTKSLPKSILSEYQRKSLLEDLHGEILAIRGFRRFILKELTKESSEYFKWEEQKGKMRLKEEYQVILYCSEIFCGDCCVDEKQQQFSGAKPLKYINCQRYPEMKYEANILRSKPGRLDLPVHKRSPLLSCSDILAFFNLVGVQGKQLFSLVTPIYLGTVIVDCEPAMRQNVMNGVDFIKRIGGIFNISEELAERKLFKVVIDGKERRISGQFLRNKPNIIAIEKQKESSGKSRDLQGFQLCGIVTDGLSEWINGKNGLPQGSSLKTYTSKGKISQFSQSGLSKGFIQFREGQESFKYEAIEYRLRKLLADLNDDIVII